MKINKKILDEMLLNIDDNKKKEALNFLKKLNNSEANEKKDYRKSDPSDSSKLKNNILKRKSIKAKRKAKVLKIEKD